MPQSVSERMQDPVARRLLESRIPARFAYTGLDGGPRVVPIWFHWNGRALVLGTPVAAPKVKALAAHPKVALTIDENEFPSGVLLVRGTAKIDVVQGVVPEYAKSAERYFGPEQGRAWVVQVAAMFSEMVRITIEPEWVRILDFKTRFPSAITAAMGGRKP